MMVNFFGQYFWQFRRLMLSGWTILSWVFGSPVDLTSHGLDILHDSASEQLAIFYLVATFFCVILLSNIFLAIMMEAYNASIGSGAVYKWSRSRYYVFFLNTQTLGSFRWFRTLFRYTRFPRRWYSEDEGVRIFGAGARIGNRRRPPQQRPRPDQDVGRPFLIVRTWEHL